MTRAHRTYAAVAAAALLAAHPRLGHAADVTDVRSLLAADGALQLDDRPDFLFRYETRSASIRRERCVDAQQYGCGSRLDSMGRPVLASPYRLRDVKELAYSADSTQLVIENRIGIFRDVELRVAVPVVLSMNQSLRLASGVQGTNPNDAAFSSLVEDGFLYGSPGGSTLAQGGSLSSSHSGLGDLLLGLAWAPLSEARRGSAASWKLSLDLSLPTGSKRTPTLSGGVGGNVFELQLGTAVSKRAGAFEPYLGVGYAKPIAAAGAYANERCDPNAQSFVDEEGYAVARPDQTDATMANRFAARSCNAEAHSEYGIASAPSVANDLVAVPLRPGDRTTFFVGTEIVPWEHDEMKIWFDVRFMAELDGAGRDFTEVSDFLNITQDPAQGADVPAGVAASRRARSVFVPLDGLGELTWHDSYAVFGGLLGVEAQLTRSLRLFAMMDVRHATDHVLTNESVGKDLNGNGKVDPYFCPVTANGTAASGCGPMPASVGPSGASLTLQPGDLYVNTDPTARREQNPSYNALVDQPGRRLVVADDLRVGLALGLTLSF